MSPIEVLRAAGEDPMASVLIRMGDELLLCGQRYEATWRALEATRTTLQD